MPLRAMQLNMLLTIGMSAQQVHTGLSLTKTSLNMIILFGQLLLRPKPHIMLGIQLM
jgi:hypothetical protein